jgi:hypothetical protein
MSIAGPACLEVDYDLVVTLLQAANAVMKLKFLREV